MKLKEMYEGLTNKSSFLQKKWLLALIIIATASLGRLSYLNLVEFKGDESFNLFLATRPLFGHPMPPASLASSVGILNFPLLNYFLFPITLMSYYPPFVSGVIGLLNVLAIGIYFLLIAKYLNKLTGFLSALFLALAPWSILYGRKIWAQDFLIPLTVVLLFCFFKIYKEKKQIFWLFYGIISLFLIQIHQTAGILPVLLSIPLVKNCRPNMKFLSLGILIGLLPTIPYFWYEIANRCPDCTTFFLLHNKLQQYHPDIFLRLFQIMTTNYFHTLFGNTDNLLFITIFPMVNKLSKVFYLMYIVLPLAASFFWMKYKEYRSFMATLLLSLAAFFLLKIQPEMHYVIIFLPFLCLFVGSFFAFLLQYSRAIFRISAISFCLLFITTYLVFDYSFFKFLSFKKGFGGDYGQTYQVAAASAKQNLKIYEHNPEYTEMTLAYYVPKESIQGDTPVGQILYPLSFLAPRIKELNQTLKQQKDYPDPRIVNEVLAYYTYPQNETDTNIFYLKDLSKKSSTYHTIYSMVLEDYLYTNHKHYFTNENIWIEYPEHWKETTTNTSLTLSDENVIFTLSQGEVALPQLNSNEKWQTNLQKIYQAQTTRYDCLGNSVWCGSYIPSLNLNEKLYSVIFIPLNKNIPSNIVQNERKVLDSILQSLQPVGY